MAKNRSRFVPGASFAEAGLEPRLALSAAGAALARGGAEVSALAVRRAATKTTLAITAGTLGQPITFNVTVRAAARAGAPAGTVRIMDRGKLVGTIALTPSSPNGRFATSSGTLTLVQPPGGAAYYFGKHKINAVFVPEGKFARSTVAKAFTVKPPAYTTLAGGTKIATIAPGSGAEIRAGQTANVLYTGYLAKNGAIFDNSLSHGGEPLAFTVGRGQVIPGFDDGTLGMRVGETRIISIPPSQGYGPNGNGPIPGNASLIFVVTLRSIT